MNQRKKRRNRLGIYYVPFILFFYYFSCSSPGPEYFNRTASSTESKPDEILKNLSLSKGDKIADIGSGGGYFSFRFSEIVGPKGLVYSVDVDKKLLNYIRQKAQEKNITNIQFLEAKEDDSGLPDDCCDIIFFRNVYHHLPNRITYFTQLKNKLKKQGSIVIIENKKTILFSLTAILAMGHYTQPEKISNEMNKAGYQKIAGFKFIKKQSFQIFKPR